jgi:enoyl-CoA hydratase/carnithine racemase
MQKYAEEAAKKQMEVVQKNFDSHWKNMEPWRDEHGKVIPDFIENIAKRLYEKNPKAYKITKKQVKQGDKLTINEARGGGFAISIFAQ